MRHRLAWLTAATALALLAAPFPVQGASGAGGTPGDCGGPGSGEAAQSPIEIDRSLACPHAPVALSIHYPSSVHGEVTFQDREPIGEPSEHDDVRFVIATDAAQPYIRYGGLRYDLRNVHFHGHAEHKFAGEPFAPVEAHFVHERTASPAGYVVLSVLLDRQRYGRPSEHDRLMQAPPALGESKELHGVHLRSLLPGDRTTYRYTGSLTTPDDEGVYFQPVNWVVFDERAAARPDIIREFRSLWPDGTGNRRELQVNEPAPDIYQSR